VRAGPPPIQDTTRLSWRVRRATIVRLMRYSAVSLVATSTSLVTLGILVGLAGLPATWSNVIATGAGTVPSFELNRRWVWNHQGPRSLLGQIVPFCCLSFAGLVLSTVAVGVVAGRTSGWGHWSHTVAVMAANLAAYGTLWAVQFHLLNRVLFRTPQPESAPPVTPETLPPAPFVDARPSGREDPITDMDVTNEEAADRSMVLSLREGGG
jgi:putative flippase GtrA